MTFEITSEMIALASIVSSAIIAIFTTYLNIVYGPKTQENARLKSEKETRIWSQNEERFFSMLTNLEGFYVLKSGSDKAIKMKNDFVTAYRHVWLYSSDEVIRKINAFIVSEGYSTQIETPQDKAARDMVFIMRKTIHGDTTLKPEEFLIASAK